MPADILRHAINILMVLFTSALSALVVQRATVLHTFEPVPQAQRAAIRFCPDDPWRLTVKNLSFIAVNGLKVAYVYRGLTDAKIETDRDWVLYPNGPADRKDSGHYYSWDLGGLLAGETVSIVFCMPKGLAAADVRALNNRERILVRTDNANSIDVTNEPARPLIDTPLLALLGGWLIGLGGGGFLLYKLFGFVSGAVARRRKPHSDVADAPRA